MKDTVKVSPEEALKHLKVGHARFAGGESKHPHRSAERRRFQAESGQRPFAAVIGCSDSRVPVELIFDQGFGDLFVVRVPGNVCNGDEIAAIEYAVEHLHTPLCVILGHTHCGAVTGVVSGTVMGGHLGQLVRTIYPAAKDAMLENPSLMGQALVEATVRRNVLQGLVELASESDVISRHVTAGTLRLAGAVYDVASGSLEWL